MTKRELEIRLEIAERVIAENIYFLTDEYLNKVKEENNYDLDNANYYLKGKVDFKLNQYKRRAEEAVERNGKDIYK